MRALIPLVLGSLLALNVAQAAPPAFPEKPIRLVLGSAPGSGPDIIARALADRLYGAWGQRIVVDARPGVAGILSADLVLRTVPDGYTWMILTSQLLVATSVYPNVKFNLGKDFVSVSLIGTVPFVLVGIFRYQLLSDPEEAGRRQQWAPERSSEKPEEILLGDRGIQLTLAGWLVTTAVIGLLSRAS